MGFGARDEHTLSGLLANACAQWPDEEIVIGQERCTFTELRGLAQQVADALATAGIEAGDHVGLLLPATIEMVASMFGVAQIGGTIVPINDRYKSTELAYVLPHADVRLLITTDAVSEYTDFPELLVRAFPALAEHDGSRLCIDEAPELRTAVLIGQPRDGFVSFATFMDQGALSPRTSDPVVTRSDIAFLMYTSGTSAGPKGCKLTHDGLVRQGQAVAGRWELRSGDRFWCPLPLFHNGGISALMACLAAGARYVHSGHFEATSALMQLSRERCTHALPAFEALWMPILEHSRFPDTDLSALRLVEHSGVPSLLRRIQDRLPQAKVVAQYGLTEASGHLCITRPDDSATVRSETSGLPLPEMEVCVVSEQGERQPAGEPGEICFRGPMRFAGYHKDRDANKTIGPDGWFHTGDYGLMDAGRRLVYLGRLKDVLKVGGENVSAAEIEAFLIQQPGIRAASVVSAPDARYTEVPAAFVELEADSPLDEQTIIDSCIGHIASFKVPRYVRFIHDWPMSGTKVKKHVLREWIANELADAATLKAEPLRKPSVNAGA